MTNEELCMMIQSGTGNKQECLEQLYTQNAGIIEKVIRRYQDFEELDDLRQEAYFGIVRAAQLWKPEKDVQFITYAVFWIRSAIRRYIDNCSGVIRVPVNKRTLIGQHNKTVHSYLLRFGRRPTDQELCAALELEPEQLRNLRNDMQKVKIRSTSEPIGEEGDSTLEDFIPAAGDQYEELVDRVQNEELGAVLWEEVDKLAPKQAAVIRDRYKNGHTLQECGEALGCSQQYAKALESKALRALRHGDHLKRLRPYLTETAAYSKGMKRTGYTSFMFYGSVQERILMQLEEQTEMSLYNGKEILA